MANRDSDNFINEEEILQKAKGTDVQSLMQKLSPEQQKAVKNILSDPAKTQQILANPKIQSLIRKLKNNERH